MTSPAYLMRRITSYNVCYTKLLRSSTRRAQTMGGHLSFDESVIEPVDIAAMIDEWYGKPISSISEMGRQYREANSWSALKPQYMKALESIL